jgi:penicillin-binding protein 2
LSTPFDSCNVFFYNSGTEMGVWDIANEARRFHLDQRTGIELPGETGRMLIPDPEWKAARFYGESWFTGDTANMSIGQGFLLITPMQMAVFAASIGRETTFIQPTLLHGQRDQPLLGDPIGLPVRDLALVKEGMRQAGERGTARLAGNPDLPVAGKTGTAQVRKDGRPTTLAWFVGYAPVQNPRVAVAVLVEGVPDETEYGGGSTAAPIAKAVFQEYINPEEAPQ